MRKEIFPQRRGSTGLAVILAMAVLIFSCADNHAKRIVAVAPVKMNVFYLGVNNPVTIAVSGAKDADITASIDNGTIEKSGSFYIVKPQKTGLATISVSLKGKLIGTPQFRVKVLPDPVAKLDGMRSGTIEKSKILNAPGLTAEIEGSDFDAPFKVVSFNIASTRKGFVVEEQSNDGSLTLAQKTMINSLAPHSKIYFEDIKAIGPDGQIRSLSMIDFTLE